MKRNCRHCIGSLISHKHFQDQHYNIKMFMHFDSSMYNNRNIIYTYEDYVLIMYLKCFGLNVTLWVLFPFKGYIGLWDHWWISSSELLWRRSSHRTNQCYSGSPLGWIEDHSIQGNSCLWIQQVLLKSEVKIFITLFRNSSLRNKKNIVFYHL